MRDPREPDYVTLAVTRADGGLSITRVVTAEYAPDPDRPGERIITASYEPTPEYFEHLITKNNEIRSGGMKLVSWRLVPNSYLRDEDDMTFRAALQDDGKGDRPVVNMQKAREIQRQIIREQRAPMLEALDAEYMQALERNDQERLKSIAEQKQELRDAPANKAIDRARTTADLKRITL